MSLVVLAELEGQLGDDQTLHDLVVDLARLYLTELRLAEEPPIVLGTAAIGHVLVDAGHALWTLERVEDRLASHVHPDVDAVRTSDLVLGLESAGRAEGVEQLRLGAAAIVVREKGEVGVERGVELAG